MYCFKLVCVIKNDTPYQIDKQHTHNMLIYIYIYIYIDHTLSDDTLDMVLHHVDATRCHSAHQLLPIYGGLFICTVKVWAFCHCSSSIFI